MPAATAPVPNPKDVFSDPQTHWTLLTAPTDVVMESQTFDRKEACQPDHTGAVSGTQLDRLKRHVVECVSAFANTNPAGGLIVVGIARDGRVTEMAHLRDEQRNDLTNLNNNLMHHAAEARFFDCTNAHGAPDRICLIYAAYAERAICETRESRPKAWTRHGAQNLLLNDEQRERIRRDETWLPAYRRKAERSGRSIYNTEKTLGKWIVRPQPETPFLGKIPLRKLTVNHFDALYLAMEEKHGSSRVGFSTCMGCFAVRSSSR